MTDVTIRPSGHTPGTILSPDNHHPIGERPMNGTVHFSFNHPGNKPRAPVLTADSLARSTGGRP
ncbi:MAG: hypothetical protein ACLQBP_02870 [Methanoregula sp.]|uniref:hypothetical protein n=1 Tax=Methanoregula sp. TaxID=2052170 RepID=UPI003BAF2D91